MTRYFIISLALLPSARAADPPPPTIQAELLPSARSVSAGQSLDLGVRLSLPEGWHIYWANPGDTGMATEVSLIAPAGFAAGALGWPGPERFTAPGDIVSYGYEGETLLLLPVTPPANLPATGESALTVEVYWLACRAICVPGQARLSVTLPHTANNTAVNTAVNTDNTAALAPWRARLPTPFEGGITLSGTDAKPTLRLDAPGAAAFFPGPGMSAEVLTERAVAGSLEVDLRAMGRPDRLQGVLSVTTDAGPAWYTIEQPWPAALSEEVAP